MAYKKDGNFDNDIKQEQVIRPFIESHIYPAYYDKITPTERKEDQDAGIDTILDDGNHDLKIQVNSYICNPTETFALEINCLKKDDSGAITPGWFIRPMKTDFYDFMWIFDADYEMLDGDYRFVSKPETLRRFELMTVPVQELKKRIFEKISKEKLIEAAQQLRAEHMSDARKLYYKQLGDDFRLVLSKNLKEEPINLVVPLDFYQQFCTRYIDYNEGLMVDINTWDVRPEKVVEIHGIPRDNAVPRCPRCGKELKIRTNRKDNSKFYACPGWPDCKYTKSI